MSENVAPREQYQLRVKAGSRLGLVMDRLASGEYVSKDELVELAGVKDIWWQLRGMSDWFDNLALDFPYGRNTVRMSHVAPTATQVVQHIHQAEFAGGAVAPVPADDVTVGELIWPDAPPLIDSMGDRFDKPEYFDLMGAVVESGRHVAMSGPPGIGKSTSVEELAAQRHKPLVNISCEGGLRKRDLAGTPEIVNGTSKFLVAEYAAAAVFGWWVKIDEVNAADADALLFLNGQLAPPFIVNIHGKQYPVHPEFRLFITYNRGLVGTKPLPPAFKDRFFPVKLQFPTAYRLRRLLERNGMPPTDGLLDGTSWQELVVEFGLRMWKAHTDGRMRYQISPRRLMDAAFLHASGLDGGDIALALRSAVIDTIDSELEAKEAGLVLYALTH